MATPIKTEHSSGASLRAAILLNAVFLMLTVLFVRVGFESNDDLTLAAFVDGQMAQSTPFIPYINIVLGWLLKLIYDVLGRDAAWHTYCQYALLFLGLTALCFAVCEKLGVKRGLAVGTVLLLFFGVDVYSLINYTKTAAVCTVGGMALLLTASERESRRAPLLVPGVLLAVFGFMLRMMEFLPCFAITAALALRPFRDILAGRNGTKVRRVLRLALPFVLVLAISAGFYAVNEWAWSKEPWSIYHEFDAIRVDYSDYGRPAYQDMPDAYDALGLSEADVKLLGDGDYFDPDAFSGAVMQSITEARDERFPHPSAGECVGLFLDKAVPGFFSQLPVYGLLLILILWLAAGEHGWSDLLSLLFAAGIFGAAYLYLIYRGRYLVARVDLGLLLALAAAPALTLNREKLQNERMLTLAVLALALVSSYFLTRGSFRSVEAEDKSETRAAYEELLKDDRHVYLAKLDAVTDGLWSPFEPVPAGYWDRIVLLGGFDCLHPTIMDNLARYGVTNPYRDSVGNSKVYIIEDNIELTLDFIRQHYDSQARAVPVEPLSTRTGMSIYRILK